MMSFESNGRASSSRLGVVSTTAGQAGSAEIMSGGGAASGTGQIIFRTGVSQTTVSMWDIVRWYARGTSGRETEGKEGREREGKEGTEREEKEGTEREGQEEAEGVEGSWTLISCPRTQYNTLKNNMLKDGEEVVVEVQVVRGGRREFNIRDSNPGKM